MPVRLIARAKKFSRLQSSRNRLLALLWTTVLSSLLSYLALSTIYLGHFADQFAEDFSKQNAPEILRGDAPTVARKLEALSSSLPWVCILGERNGLRFYEKKKIVNCETTPWRRAAVISDARNPALVITFLLTLPFPVILAGILFFVWQLLLFCVALVGTGRLERARQADLKTFGEFAAHVAHDVRAPLAALRGIISASEQLPADERSLIANSVSRIEGIATQLLDYRKNRASSQRVAGNVTRFNISAAITNLVNERGVSLDRRRISIQIDDKLEPIFVLGDEAQLIRAISNILNNACEAVESGGQVKIKVSGMGTHVELSVQDNGYGIPAHVLEQLGKKELSFNKEGGNGLGIFSAQKIIEQFGGRVLIESQLGSGTLVRLTLPVVRAV